MQRPNQWWRCQIGQYVLVVLVQVQAQVQVLLEVLRTLPCSVLPRPASLPAC